MKELNRLQNEIGTWQARVCPPAKRTPEQLYNRSLEETAELSRAIERKDKGEIAEEATDVIVRMLGIIAVVGGNATELLNDKVDELQKKYDAFEIETKLKAGVKYEDVMSQHKNNWKPRNGKVIPLYTGYLRSIK